MIKINLLEVEKERRPKPTVTGGVPTSALAVAVFGVVLGAFVLYFLHYSNKLADLERDVEQKRIKKKELEPYIKRVDELEKRKNDLEKRNRAIEALRSQRTIPVHILDEVSRNLPDYLWVNTMSIRGDVLTIDGQTLQEQAIPKFMKNLDASEFIGTCSLIETNQRPAGQTVSTTFRISAPITNPFKPKVSEEKTRKTS